MNATEAINSIVKLLGLQFKKETFASTFLVDGETEVTNNTDSELEVGQTLYVVKDSTLTPAPSGSHETREGFIVTLDGESTIIAIASKETDKTEVKSAKDETDDEEESDKDIMDDDDDAKLEMTKAEDSEGKILESSTFDVGEKVYTIKEDGSKEPCPDGEKQVVLKDESGKENKIRITVKDGIITERENVEEMMKPDMMESDFTQDISDIKNSIQQLLSVIDSMNGKFKTELNSLKTDFDSFKKSPERKAVEETKTYTQSFSDYQLELIKSLRNK
jgi:hypothetical protein